MLAPRVISRGPSPLPLRECLSLNIRIWPDIGATSEIKMLVLPPRPENVGGVSAPVKIYVENGVQLVSNLFRECDQIIIDRFDKQEITVDGR